MIIQLSVHACASFVLRSRSDTYVVIQLSVHTCALFDHMPIVHIYLPAAIFGSSLMQPCVAPLSPYSIWQAEYLRKHPWVHMPDTMEAVHAASPTRVAKVAEAPQPRASDANAANVAEAPQPKASDAKAAKAPAVQTKTRRI